MVFFSPVWTLALMNGVVFAITWVDNSDQGIGMGRGSRILVKSGDNDVVMMI